jgi:hypothetical protein
MPAQTDRRIAWRRSPVPRDALPLLNQRSDWKGLVQAGGHLALLLLTGVAAWAAFFRLAGPARIPVFLAVLYLHGALWAFLLNGFHELCHSRYRTITMSPALRPNVSGAYISSAFAGGTTKRPGVVPGRRSCSCERLPTGTS